LGERIAIDIGAVFSPASHEARNPSPSKIQS
jgi:hypothetical protein